jgi:RimJ/RimL family protein N-acetyltransferase
LEPASAADIPAIMRIERLEGYDWFIGRFDEDKHREQMASADARYLVWREAGEVAAFVLLLKLTNPHGVVEAKTIAAAEPGKGLGRRLVPAVMDWVFENTEANRLELDCSMVNPRALRVYEREGFVREGVVREVYRLEDGAYVSAALFSILRREWEALRKRA